MARPKQKDLPISGEGIAPEPDKKLDNLCDEFIELRDDKAKLAEDLGVCEVKILDRMVELNREEHRFGDQLAKIKKGKNRIKIKTVKTEAPEK